MSKFVHFRVGLGSQESKWKVTEVVQNDRKYIQSIHFLDMFGFLEINADWNGEKQYETLLKGMDSFEKET